MAGGGRTIEADATSPGSRTAVWALLEDAGAWSRWGSWSRVEMEGGGPPRVGAVRVLHRAPYHLRERITEWVPGERMAYELLEGCPCAATAPSSRSRTRLPAGRSCAGAR